MPGTTCTSYHPFSPKLSRICLVACTSTGAVRYSHFVMLATLVLARDPVDEWLALTRGRRRRDDPPVRAAGCGAPVRVARGWPDRRTPSAGTCGTAAAGVLRPRRVLATAVGPPARAPTGERVGAAGVRRGATGVPTGGGRGWLAHHRRRCGCRFDGAVRAAGRTWCRDDKDHAGRALRRWPSRAVVGEPGSPGGPGGGAGPGGRPAQGGRARHGRRRRAGASRGHSRTAAGGVRRGGPGHPHATASRVRGGGR